MKNTILRVLVIFFSIYLLFSALYIFMHINFGERPDVVGMGFNPSQNVIRILLGVPPTYTTYDGVSPFHLIRVVLRAIIAVVLIVLSFKKKKVKI